MTVIGPNLTPGRGSAMAPLSDDEFATVLRHGVRPDGTAVTGMPADRFQHLSRDDMRALISYLRQLPPVDRELPASSITLVGRASWAFGHVQLQPARGLVDHKRVPLARTPEAPVEHGRYLGKVGGCTACHGRYLSGGRMPGALPGDPSPPNLTMDETGLVGWTRDEFDKAVRQGIGRDGRALTPSMPSAAFAGLSDGEIDALWTYLPTVTPRPYGNR